MTRKHFREIAKALGAIMPSRMDYKSDEEHLRDWNTWSACVDAIADVCKEANPRFDRRMFRAACEMGGV